MPIFALVIGFTTTAFGQPETEIRALLESQQEAWNAGNIEEYMAGYVKSEELHFLGKNGLTEGWHGTLKRYQERYPDRKAMGTLDFEFERITRRTDEIYTVVGQYFLEREDMENLNGYFLLVVQQTENGWKVAADSTH